MVFSKKKVTGSFAGLALHEDSLRYLELERSGAGFHVVRQEFVAMPAGGVVKESLQDMKVLESSLEELKAQVGKFSCPVVLGIPSRDVTLRLVEYPRMSQDDVRDALSLEFEKYFPYSWANACVHGISQAALCY